MSIFSAKYANILAEICFILPRSDECDIDGKLNSGPRLACMRTSSCRKTVMWQSFLSGTFTHLSSLPLLVLRWGGIGDAPEASCLGLHFELVFLLCSLVLFFSFAWIANALPSNTILRVGIFCSFDPDFAVTEWLQPCATTAT
ncbi:hypothetical protein C8R45DRAFT_118181 [Mycena sanguinolenta]|nr:hypothetical protein C8R45DRAFT_118181 [Mycena sanguinolenta]